MISRIKKFWTGLCDILEGPKEYSAPDFKEYCIDPFTYGIELAEEAMILIKESVNGMPNSEIIKTAAETARNCAMFELRDHRIKLEDYSIIIREIREWEKRKFDACDKGEKILSTMSQVAKVVINFTPDETDYSHGGPMGDDWPLRWALVKGGKFSHLGYTRRQESIHRDPGFSDSLDLF